MKSHKKLSTILFLKNSTKPLSKSGKEYAQKLKVVKELFAILKQIQDEGKESVAQIAIPIYKKSFSYLGFWILTMI